jgi:hypothetical protein
MTTTKDEKSVKEPSKPRAKRKPSSKGISKKKPSQIQLKRLEGFINFAELHLHEGKPAITICVQFENQKMMYVGKANEESIADLLNFLAISRFSEIGNDKVCIDVNAETGDVVRLTDRRCQYQFVHKAIK